MSQWREVSRCKSCGKVYSNGVSEICSKCGTRIAITNRFKELLDLHKCMDLTINAERVVAKRKWFKWVFKEVSE